MTYTKFSQLTQRAMQRKQKARCAVVSAEDEYTMEAVLRAGREGLIEPILIGDEEIISELLADHYYDKSDVTICHEPNHEAAAHDQSQRGAGDEYRRSSHHRASGCDFPA